MNKGTFYLYQGEHGLFVKQWSSEAKGKHLERHRVPDNKLEAYSDLKKHTSTSKKNILSDGEKEDVTTCTNIYKDMDNNLNTDI